LSEVGLWLENINLAYNNAIGYCVDVLVQFLDHNMKLKSLDLRDEDDILSASGWKRVLGVLHRTSITKLSGICCYDNTVLPEIFYQMIGSGSLNELEFGQLNVAESRRLSSSLENPNVKLERLAFRCMILNQRELWQLVPHWTTALRNNSTLKTLHICCFISARCYSVGVWQQFIDAIFNQDSIEATYNSNHTLQTLEFDFVAHEYEQYDSDEDDGSDEDDEDDDFEAKWKMPDELNLLLEMNQSTDKSAVARRKVIKAHFGGSSTTQKLLDLNVGSKATPQLLSWIGKEQSELSMMFGFLRSIPSTFEKACTTSALSDRKRMRNE
jgi:hypothetical protein